VQDGAVLGSTGETALEITPVADDPVTGIISVPGYNLYQETFPVIEAYGTLTGHVDAAGTPAGGAILRGYDAENALVFEATADAAGDYDVGREIPVAPYTITIDYFGYLQWEEPFFINYGANVLDVDLEPAPSGILSGTVLEDETDLPLEATVKVYRSDNDELYVETTSSPVDGTYTTPALPYFDYRVTVKAWRHIPVTIDLTVDQASIERNFWLEETIGDLLVIDDSGKGGLNPAKVDEKTGETIAEEFVSEPGKAVQDVLTDLEDLGYTCTMETMGSTDPGTWESYDLMMVCSGDNTDPLGNAAFRNDLIDFVESGGRLLVEGGEVGYDHQGDDEFAEKVLHITDWNHDQSGNVTVAAPDHYVMSVPNVIAGPISMSYSNYGDHDANVPAADAVMVGSWTSYPSDASLIAYDPNPAPEGGQIVFYCFNYSAMDAQVRPLLLQNTVTWLMTPEFGDCSVSGHAYLMGETDHSGVRIEAIPGGGAVYTDPSGAYSLDGLFAGPYTIKATKEGWSTGVEEVTLEQGQQMTGVDFLLGPVSIEERCDQPNLSIPDNNPTGVYDDINVLMSETISEIAVYVDITHTFIGDLRVSLTSPEGTSVTLHDRTGGSAHDILGWYPDDLDPAQSLDAFIGEATNGTWRLRVSDHAGADVGTLNEWCVRFTYGGGATAVEEIELPATLSLAANRPNPFHPQTAIRFALPRAERIDLAVFDVAGRRVATLAEGVTGAGYHTVHWTGRDDNGLPVSGGIYLYRLRTSEREITRKMVLLK
ncbi:MAG: T9SS type A sorting domain-containing protein, partial [Candidatus Eisenbacteria bacterium]|nr:T9SS type A sorting domain-containing protein [Candidatus Latescibacterota bacterium]MBD3302648.1 T9SS type A sorting domain-containing protein [Candidatus Eisenbacteria bacterium]